jgi:hypothetical protein
MGANLHRFFTIAMRPRNRRRAVVAPVTLEMTFIMGVIETFFTKT